MKRKSLVLLTIVVVVVFQVCVWTFTYMSKSYLNEEMFEQAAIDNKVIGIQLITLLKKTGLGENNPESDSILQQICDEVKMPNGGFICAIDSQGNLIAGPGLNPGMSMPFDPVLLKSIDQSEKISIKYTKEEDFTGFANFEKEGRIDVVASIAVNENLRLFIHQNTEIISQRSEKYVKPFLFIGLVITGIVGLIVYLVANQIIVVSENQIEIQNNKLKETYSDLKIKETEIAIQKGEFDRLRNPIVEMQEIIAEKNKDIHDSIRYAQRIQNAALSKKEIDKSFFSEHFILFMPRDIVSGDFYWYHDFENFFIIAAADCTGHGVPGAFMSMIGMTFLNEIILDEQVYDAAKILEQMRKDVILALDQDNNKGGASDGMNMSICIFDKKKRTMQYAGSYHPLVWIRNGALFEIKANRMPVGIYEKMNDHFTNHCIDLEKNDVIYLFSDGYADQFGGLNDRKFMTKNFKHLLLEMEGFNMENQKTILFETLKKWQGNNIQVDDILVIGLKVN